MPRDAIDHWTSSTRRGKPCIEGYRRSDGSMIHVYWMPWTDTIIVDLETDDEYELGKPKEDSHDGVDI